MSVGMNYLLPVVFGGLAIAAAVVVAVLQRCLNRGDRGVVIPSDAGSNPYQTPSELGPVDQSSSPGFENRTMRHFKGMVVLPFACVLSGASVGVVSRLCRPYANVGGSHYEALAALVILIAFALILVFVNRAAKLKLAHLFFQLENFSLWVGYACGWMIAHRGFWDDIVIITIAFLVCSAFVGSVLLWGLQTLKSRQVTH
jgi:hypothetical protein